MIKLPSADRSEPSRSDVGQTALAAALVGFVAAGILPLGAVHPWGIEALAAAIIVFAAGVMVLLREHPGARAISRLAVTLAAVFALYILWQTRLIPADLLDNGLVRGLTGGLAPAPTWPVRPTGDAIALVCLLTAPFLLFIAAVSVGRNDETAKKVAVFLALLGAALAVYALLQRRFLPPAIGAGDWALQFRTLPELFGDADAAATFLGLTMLAQAGQIARSMYGFEWLDTIARAFDPWRPLRKRERRAFIYLGMLGLTLIALLMTGSLNGWIATAVGLTVFVIVGVIASRRPGEVTPSRTPRAALVAVYVVLSAAILVGGYLAATSADLAALTGESGLCNVGGVIQALRDHWVFGLGIDGLAEGSIPYRDPACVENDAWARADGTVVAGFLAVGVVFPILLTLGGLALAGNFIAACRRRHRHNWASMLGLGCLGLAGAQSLLRFPLDTPAVILLLAVVLGTSTALAIDQRATAAADRQDG
ncbi:hypothetical protein [Chthonobacter rhizosphaerae]|uniref:hypothetical protein n=1 Tax=Chthonobacter rhizosphaerae TaxID=2735553 RepID=UPI0015EF6B37|nr:hypothetical protein [Chthonobacter rhizosphaerae]